MRIVRGTLVVAVLGLALSGCAGLAEKSPRPRVPAGWQAVSYGKCSTALPGDWKVVSTPSAGTSDVYRGPDASLFYLEEFAELDRPPAREPLPEFVAKRNDLGKITETSRRTVTIRGTVVAYRITGTDAAGGEITVLHTWGNQTGGWLVLTNTSGSADTAEQIVRTYSCAL